MLDEKILELKRELALYEAIRKDFVHDGVRLMGVRVDAVYDTFCRMHPDIEVSRQKFSRIVGATLGVKSVQAYVDGVRGSFYDVR